MADNRKLALVPELDIQQISQEAKIRWLRASEICEILRNYRRFSLSTDPPDRPPGGSLFLFDRKALRYFRKDGHRWRKKKDGKTVRETHEKLKCGSVNVLHCYYAHGEDNDNFQRRCYWLLDEELDHIVLVHYRDLCEGSGPSIPLNTDATAHLLGAQSSSAICSTHLSSSNFATQSSYMSSPSTADWRGQAPTSEFENADSEDDIGCSVPISHPYTSGLMDTATRSSSYPSFTNQVSSPHLMLSEGHQNASGTSLGTGSFGGAHLSHQSASSTWPDILSLNQKIDIVQDQQITFKPHAYPDSFTRRISNSISNSCVGVEHAQDGGYKVVSDASSRFLMGDGKSQVQVKVAKSEILNTDLDSTRTYQVPHEHHFLIPPQFKNNSGSQADVASTDQPQGYTSGVSHALKNVVESDSYNHQLGELNKLDSFGRWMNKEIGKDCEDSLMASDSYWNPIDTQNDDKEVSSLSRQMQLDIGSPGPSLSHEQLFSILDISPDWAFSGVETKVLISGTFLGGTDPSCIRWCCMFGEDEVAAEVLTTNVIRCQAPAHTPGRVPFYITCSNRLACSEIREFEYRENRVGVALLSPLKSEPEDEVHYQVRFARMLSTGINKRRLDCSVENCTKCNLKENLFPVLGDNEIEWDKINSKGFQEYNRNPKDALIQKLLKGKLYEWLVSKVHEEGKGPNVLDEDGQGVIHLASALGYNWALSSIVAAGVSPNFRDARGRTALHWAALFGREKVVVELVALGAAPGAVDDPTSKSPEGQTAADSASRRGHKGIAGYLAEADLTSHLSLLKMVDREMDGASSNLAAEKAEKTVQELDIVLADGNRSQESLRGSLAAVRNSAQAAARIQAAFRFQSFHQGQLAKSSDEISAIADTAVMLSSINSKANRKSHFSDYLHTAAVKIQQKYRGYKGRKEYLRTRNQIVKIQALVRGHQVRKLYKKIVWSVSIVEKVILRWRRKASGLRGFRSEQLTGSGQEVGNGDEYDFLHLGRQKKVAGVERALARVQSMARDPEARDQYMRLATSSHGSKLGDEGRSSAEVQCSEEEKKVEEDPGIH